MEEKDKFESELLITLSAHKLFWDQYSVKLKPLLKDKKYLRFYEHQTSDTKEDLDKFSSLYSTNLKLQYGMKDKSRASLVVLERPFLVEELIKELKQSLSKDGITLTITADETNLFSLTPDKKRLYWNNRIIFSLSTTTDVGVKP